MAKSLIDLTLAEHPELEKYHSLYNDRLSTLVQAKIEGKEIAKPPAERSGPPVINIIPDEWQIIGIPQ